MGFFSRVKSALSKPWIAPELDVFPREWEDWESVPVNVKVEDVDGDTWVKTGNGLRDFTFNGRPTVTLRPDSIDAPYIEVI